MANIKVSEMTEATSFDDGDYTMIVQANQNKKISKENMLSDIPTIQSNIATINNNIGDLTDLETSDKTNLVAALNEVNTKNVITASFENYRSTGTIAPITNLMLVSQVGNALTLQNNGIKIGANISKVLVSGWAFNNTNTNGVGFIGGITKNGNAYDENNIYAVFWVKSSSANDNITLTLPPTMINVSENDIINFGVGINGNTTNVFNRGCVTVEVIE